MREERKNKTQHRSGAMEMPMRAAALLFVLAFSAPSRLLSQEVAIRMYSSEELREDAAYLYETLQATHYDLYANTSKETFDAAFHALCASLTTPLDYLGAYRLFQPFAALAKHAHCSIGFPFEQSYGPYVQGGGTLFPLDASIVGGRMFVLYSYADNPEVMPGDEILSINGRSVAQVMHGIHAFLSGDGVVARIEAKQAFPLALILGVQVDLVGLRFSQMEHAIEDATADAGLDFLVGELPSA